MQMRTIASTATRTVSAVQGPSTLLSGTALGVTRTSSSTRPLWLVTALKDSTESATPLVFLATPLAKAAQASSRRTVWSARVATLNLLTQVGSLTSVCCDVRMATARTWPGSARSVRRSVPFAQGYSVDSALSVRTAITCLKETVMILAQ